MPDGLDRDRVPMAGGALLIAAVATCDLVRTRIIVRLLLLLVVLSLLAASFFVLFWLPLQFC